MWRIVTFGMHLTLTMLISSEQKCHTITYDIVNFEFEGSKS